jgi:hypothetical protein
LSSRSRSSIYHYFSLVGAVPTESEREERAAVVMFRCPWRIARSDGSVLDDDKDVICRLHPAIIRLLGPTPNAVVLQFLTIFASIREVLSTWEECWGGLWKRVFLRAGKRPASRFLPLLLCGSCENYNWETSKPQYRNAEP